MRGQKFKLTARKAFVVAIRRNWVGFEWQNSGADGHESRIPVVTLIIERSKLTGGEIQGGMLFVPCYYCLT